MKQENGGSWRQIKTEGKHAGVNLEHNQIYFALSAEVKCKFLNSLALASQKYV